LSPLTFLLINFTKIMRYYKFRWWFWDSIQNLKFNIN